MLCEIAVCDHFPCPTTMFLTTPECILKSSSSASVSKDFFPSLTSFFFQLFNGDQTFTQSDFLFLFLNYFYSSFTMWHSAYDDLCPPLCISCPPPISSILLPPGPARAGSSLNILTNSQHHPARWNLICVSPRPTGAWTRRLWAL